MADANKIMYGLRNVHYAIATETNNDGVITTSYGTVKAWTGAVNISLSPEGSQDPFYADDSIYVMLNSNSGYTGSLESALIPEDVLTSVLGQSKDADTGLITENKDDSVKYIALLFEVQGDQKARRFCFYRCYMARPEITGDTVAESVEPSTQTIDITCSARPDDGKIKAFCHVGDGAYDTFFDAVPVVADESS